MRQSTECVCGGDNSNYVYTCTEGNPITLDGSRSCDAEDCPDGQPCTRNLDFDWDINLNGSDCPLWPDGGVPYTCTNDGPNGGTFTITCPAPGTYTLKLSVRDQPPFLYVGNQYATLYVMAPADLVISNIATVEPYRPDTSSNITITVTNEGQVSSGQYLLDYRISMGPTTVAAGEEAFSGLPGGTSRKNITMWVPTEPGLYNVECQVTDIVTGETDTESIVVLVQATTSYIGPEYPALLLLTLLVALPATAYYMMKQRRK
jgi:hypothetical protein